MLVMGGLGATMSFHGDLAAMRHGHFERDCALHDRR
jgi:hypothetical protein